VVGADNKVAIRSVQTGERVDTRWIIEKGLKAGERVIAEGTLKVRDGVTITPVPYKAATGSP
jgi:membrane fusion protein (multidrug efflux system)